jgi:hypothetical protein
VRESRDDDHAPTGGAPSLPPGSRGLAPAGGTSPGDDPSPGTSPGDDPIEYPGSGNGTSPGDDPFSMPVRGRVDPPGFWDDFGITGALEGSRLDATMDPRGWGNDIRLTGRVDGGGWQTESDPAGWSNTTKVTGRRTSSGYEGTVDRPGLWNDVDHRISETIRGAQVLREGRFDESWTPTWNEAVWRSGPDGSNLDRRVLEFDPPGWSNTTKVTLEANVPAGVEATIAATLYDGWKTEQERQDDYPDPAPGGTAPGDDGGYPTSPGDDYPTAPGYPTGPGDDYPTDIGYPYA